MNLYELKLPGRRRATISLVKDKAPLPVSTLRGGKTAEAGRVYYNCLECRPVFGDGFDVAGLDDFGEGSAAAIAELLVEDANESGERMAEMFPSLGA